MTARPSTPRSSRSRKTLAKPTARRKATSRRPSWRASWRTLFTTPRGKIALVALALILLVAAYVVAALAAAANYRSHLSTGNFDFTGHINFTGQDFLSPLDSDMAFNGSYSSSKPLQAQASFTGNWASHQYAGSGALADGRVFFNLIGPDMPVIRYRQSTFLLPLTAGHWYSAKADESLYNNLCEHDQPATLQGKLEFYRLIKNLKLSPSPLVNFWSSVGASPATHLSGSLSGTQLAEVWSAYGKAAPPGCADPNTIGFTADDLKHVTTQVDLFTGHAQDQLVISLSDKTLGAKATITLITSNYGHAKATAKPASSTDLNALYASFGLK